VAVLFWVDSERCYSVIKCSLAPVLVSGAKEVNIEVL
jgi:hypothetical protein